MIGYKKALDKTLECIRPVGVESVSVTESIDRIAGADMYALVNSPSEDVSLKDGYAVCPADIAHAGPENPVKLTLQSILTKDIA